MEEGQTVEIQETREPLREQGSVRALLELLEQQGMEQEKGDVLRMADYIDSMEMQLGTVLKELGEVKKQLGTEVFCLYGWCSLVSGKGKMAEWRKCSDTRDHYFFRLGS